MSDLSRRRFLGATAAGLAAGTLGRRLSAADIPPAAAPPMRKDAVAVASANGVGTVATARRLMLEEEMRPVSAAVQGVALVEADPNDMSVGYGGLPNEQGVVQLDSACMDGPSHNAGSVASLEDIMHPAQVAELVMDRTDHVNLVGPGARQFAIDYGFQPQDLLTERARKAWLKWRSSRKGDDRLWPLGDTVPPTDPALADEPRPWGTIHCSAKSPRGHMGCCTTTSGLAFKIPGRIGDSPLIGCGLYCDEEVGSAGATGRGEAAILSGGSWLIVERMRAGDSPAEACLFALRRVAEQAERAAKWQPSLWKDGKPGFGLTFYALRKDGTHGSASMLGNPGSRRYAVADYQGARLEDCAIAFPG